MDVFEWIFLLHESLNFLKYFWPPEPWNIIFENCNIYFWDHFQDENNSHEDENYSLGLLCFFFLFLFGYGGWLYNQWCTVHFFFEKGNNTSREIWGQDYAKHNFLKKVQKIIFLKNLHIWKENFQTVIIFLDIYFPGYEGFNWGWLNLFWHLIWLQLLIFKGQSMAILEMKQRLWPKFLMGNPNFHPLLVDSNLTNLKMNRQTQERFSLVTQCNDSHLHLKM